MKALVTGACGFAGGNLVRHLVDSGDTVLGTVFGLLDSRGNSRNLPCETRSLDVSDKAAITELIESYKPDVIYHLAGVAFVPEAEEDFERALKINVAATHHIYRAAHNLNLGIRIVYVSSAEVYGRISSSDLPLHEGTSLKPANNYSLSKVMAEAVAARYEQYGALKSVVMRPFNHIGPYQNDRFVVSSIAKQLYEIKRGIAPPVIRIGNVSARRDFTDVRDIVRAYRLAALRGSGTYNLASGRPVSIGEILQTLINISGLSVVVETDPTRVRSTDTPEIYGSSAKAERELGWRPEIPLQETLEAVYRGYDR